MGNVTSRQAETYVDGYLLRLARTLDSILRTLNRKLSLLSSFFFSRIFGYNLVVVDPSTPSAGLTRKDSLVCSGNVCIVPASRAGVRQEEKRRRSERRRRAEAAALGEARLRKAGWGKVESGPSSPTTPVGEMHRKIEESLGEVAKAPPARSERERETVGERERGRLWVMGNLQPASTVQSGIPSSSSGRIDEQVRQRMHAQRSHLKPDSTILKRRIQPRHSSKSAHSLLASSPLTPTGGTIGVVEERDEDSPRSGVVPAEARVLPPGALSLGPSAWQPHFSNPFTIEHEPLPTIKTPIQGVKPKLSIDTHFPPTLTPGFVTSPVALDDQDPLSHRPSTSSNHPAVARTGLARKSFDTTAVRRSIDASSLRSVELHTPIDVKLLANKAVKEDKGRRVWKGEVNKAAMQHCLLQQDRRFSTAGVGEALVRVKTGELKGRRGSSPALALENEAGRRRSVATGAVVERGLARVKSAGGRRGSSPALNGGLVGVTGTGLRVESPLREVVR